MSLYELKKFLLKYPNGPQSPDQFRLEFEGIAAYFKKLHQSLTGEVFTGSTQTVVRQTIFPHSTISSAGVTGLVVGELVYWVSANYVALADRSLAVDKGPRGVVVEVVQDGVYEVAFGASGGLASVRCDTSVADGCGLMLSGTAGVAEKADSTNIQAVASGSYVWLLGFTTGPAASGHAETLLQIGAQPLFQA